VNRVLEDLDRLPLLLLIIAAFAEEKAFRVRQIVVLDRADDFPQLVRIQADLLTVILTSAKFSMIKPCRSGCFLQ